MERLRRHLAAGLSKLRSERGIALPMAMMITVVAMGLAAVPIMASINVQSGSSHNQAGNEALAAAETGAELAVLRQSELLPPSAEPCVSVNSNGTLARAGNYQTVGGARWCPPVTGSVGTASYSYEVNPCYSESGGNTTCGATCENPTAEDLIRVVATGNGSATGSTVPKRIQVTACSKYVAGPPQVIPPSTPTSTTTKTTTTTAYSTVTTTVPLPPPNIYASGQIVGIENLTMNNNAQVYNGGAGSNGSVSMVGSANVCGTVSYGTTFTTDNSSSNKAPCSAGRKAVQGKTEYPEVKMPSDIATNNSNSRLAAADPVGPNVYQRGNISWNASNKSLSVNYDQLTLEGTAPYYLCSLVLAGGSKLLAGSGKKISIFFEKPENCPGLNGAAQLQIANGTYVAADSGSGPGFYFAGSSTSGKSRIELAGGATTSQFVIYAPKSKIVANNGVNLNGVIIGQTLELGGGASINPNSAFKPPVSEEFVSGATTVTTTTTPYPSTATTTETITNPSTTVPGASTPLSFDKQAFVECSSTKSGSAPNSGC
jgi:hypothetical protein